MTPTNLAETLAIQFNYCAWTVKTNLDGISHEESLSVPPGGNSVNWVLGHVVKARLGCLAMLDIPPVLDPARLDRYERGGAPLVDPAEAMELDVLLAAYNDAQAPILEGLTKMTAEQLNAPAPFSPGDNPHETVGTLLAGLAFHEAYHLGQLGVQRRMLGRTGGIK